MFTLLHRWFTRWLTQPVNAPAPVASDPAALAAALQPGDVLLVDGKSRMSGVIKLLTRSSWSHVALYVGPRPELGRENGQALDLIEADVNHGVRALPLAEYAHLHTRICRPVGLNAEERDAVIRYAIERRGFRYDLKNVFDLARWLLPLGARRAAAGVLGSNDPQRVICSTLIAQAFQSVDLPVLPDVRLDADDATDRRTHLIRMPQHHSYIAPRDFDISPYFSVIKPVAPPREARRQPERCCSLAGAALAA